MKHNKECSCGCNIIHEERINIVNKNILSNNSLNKMANFFKIFGDQTRLKIINILLHEKMCVSDIAVILNMQHSAVSHQLKYLKNFKIVTSSKVGKIVYYELDDNHINQIFDKGWEHINE